MDRNRIIDNLAQIIVRLAGRASYLQHALALIEAGAPDARDAQLDAHMELLYTHFQTIRDAVYALPDEAAEILISLTTDGIDDAGAKIQVLPKTGDNGGIDHLALTLLHTLDQSPDEARALAISVARLVEDSGRISSRRAMPLGRGFETLFDERLQRRFALLPDRLRFLSALQDHLQLVMEEPDAGLVAIEDTLGESLQEPEKTWLDIERRVATLRFVRRNKTEDGHIRWFVRKSNQHGIVLDQLGVHGHWLIAGDVESSALARIGTTVDHVLSTSANIVTRGWRIVSVVPESVDANPSTHAGGLDSGNAYAERSAEEIIGELSSAYIVSVDCASELDSSEARKMVRQALGFTGGRLDGNAPSGTSIEDAATSRAAQFGLNALGAISRNQVETMPRTEARFELRSQDSGLSLIEVRVEGEGCTLAQVQSDSKDDQIIEFLDRVDRVADFAIPADCINDDTCPPGLMATMAACRALLASRIAPTLSQDHLRLHTKVRLVYVPSSIPHQLGGVPKVGLEFLREQLERRSARVDVMDLKPADFEVRLSELLGADVVGIGVYIHNTEEVGSLVRKLRQAGFGGRIVLGGPETRNIDFVQSSIEGWDAIIRGEAEDALPLVLEILQYFADGKFDVGLSLAQQLRGVTLRCGQAVLLCETAARNRALAITCPLPFQWQLSKGHRLKMNFTRGCPYQCVFCPNHQGRQFRPAHVDAMWRYSVLAIADSLMLPEHIRQQVAQVVQQRFGIDESLPLSVALHLFYRTDQTSDDLAALSGALEPLLDARVLADPGLMMSLLGIRDSLDGAISLQSGATLNEWQIKEGWLIAKAAILASRQLWAREGSHDDILAMLVQLRETFVLETSEDNTLVNRNEIAEFMERRKAFGLANDFIFNPGQNTIWDLTNHKVRGQADEAFIALLAENNPFAVALGVDGPSNAIMRQNRKPNYGVSDLLAVNRTLARFDVKTVANNYIMLTPETNMLEAIESFLLFLLLPVPWRDYGQSINLRVIKEETTLSNDEGLVYAHDDDGYDCPLRFAEVQQLLDRWSLTSLVHTDEIRPLLWRILEQDAAAAAVLPAVIARWKRDFDQEPEIRALANLIGEIALSGERLTETLRRVETRVRTEALIGNRTLKTFREMVLGTT
jgi:hypothetical protein